MLGSNNKGPFDDTKLCVNNKSGFEYGKPRGAIPTHVTGASVDDGVGAGRCL